MRYPRQEPRRTMEPPKPSKPAPAKKPEKDPEKTSGQPSETETTKADETAEKG